MSITSATMETEAATVAERRRYFRIDDEVSLSLQPIAAADEEARIDDFWQNEHAYSIRNNYNFQIEQHIADFNRIEKRIPELARYLRVLERQIDRITEKLAADDDDSLLAQQRVNISAQGLLCYSDNAPAPGSLVELTIKLLPSGLRLVIMARVVKSEPADDGTDAASRVSLDFEHLHEADREILVKHIHGKQMESLVSAQES